MNELKFEKNIIVHWVLYQINFIKTMIIIFEVKMFLCPLYFIIINKYG